MPDITKCSSKNCPYNSRCWRYISPPDKFQSYADFSTGSINKNGKCSAFWPVQKRGTS